MFSDTHIWHNNRRHTHKCHPERAQSPQLCVVCAWQVCLAAAQPAMLLPAGALPVCKPVFLKGLKSACQVCSAPVSMQTWVGKRQRDHSSPSPMSPCHIIGMEVSKIGWHGKVFLFLFLIELMLCVCSESPSNSQSLSIQNF